MIVPTLKENSRFGVMAGTLPCPPVGVVAHALRTTSGANRLAIWPATGRQVGNAIIWISEVNHCILKALRFVAHGVFPLHEPRYLNLVGESSKLLPKKERSWCTDDVYSRGRLILGLVRRAAARRTLAHYEGLGNQARGSVKPHG